MTYWVERVKKKFKNGICNICALGVADNDSTEKIQDKYSLQECIQCGMCSGVCPVSIKCGLNIRRLIRDIAVFKSMKIPPENRIWGCTTCGSCDLICPKNLSPANVLIELRSALVEEGRIPTNFRDLLENIFKYGNPWKGAKGKRSELTEGLKVKHVSEKTKLLYFIGCTPAYDTRAQEVARAMLECLNGIWRTITSL